MDENARYRSVKRGHSHADQNSGKRSGRCSAPRVIDSSCRRGVLFPSFGSLTPRRDVYALGPNRRAVEQATHAAGQSK